ncbi:MAG: spore germination protein [Sulfobacillus benefaciens]|uniref:Spore germination protein n=1 Tax=Sulfobacillus benefaciens TaxID=453960 RepID=A0A2T2XKF5_9FIRM|nr:MAG: spore germination protein [Sulfobacillus benefaciens]
MDETPKNPAIKLMETLKTSEETLEYLTGVDLGLLKDLITETKTFSKRLEALIQDFTQGKSSSQSPTLDQFSGDVEAAYDRLKSTVGQSPDIIIRRFFIGQSHQVPALLAFVDGLASNEMIDQDTVTLMQTFKGTESLLKNPAIAHQIIHDSVVSVGHATVETKWSKLIIDLMGGNTIVWIQGCPEVLVLDTVKYPARAISAPMTERAVKGPQEAFNEVILTQMNLIRRRIKSPNLHFDPVKIGQLSQTLVVVAHVEGVTNPELVMAVKRRLADIQIANLEYSNTLSESLSSSHSLFPQVRSTERADIVARDLSMGKVAIMVDNTPYALTLPATFIDFYQTTDDYTASFWEASLERLVRLLGLFVGLLLPPLYIALSSVDPELLPTKLVITIAGSRVGIPFPPIFEVIIMWTIIEILREAAIRLPKGLSTTLGTVGAIVVGTAVVKAALVSDIMIVIITLTALGLFTSPVYEMAVPWRILFWFVILAAYFLGVYGIILSLIVILAHLASLENFGVPYLSPFGPLRIRDLKDSWVKFPEDAMVYRPTSLRTVSPKQRTHHTKKPMVYPQLHQAQKEHFDDEV